VDIWYSSGKQELDTKFLVENLKRIGRKKDPGLDGGMIVKSILGKYNVGVDCIQLA
jgi:hypothetical protein